MAAADSPPAVTVSDASVLDRLIGHPATTMGVGAVAVGSALATLVQGASLLPAGLTRASTTALVVVVFRQREAVRRAEATAAQRVAHARRFEGALREAAEAARVAIVATDAEGRFRYANPAAAQMLGVPREALVGVSSLLYVAESDRPRFMTGLGKFLAGEGRIAAGEPIPLTGRRHSGEEFAAEVALSWLDGPNGRAVTGVIVDLSERRATEDTLRHAREQAERAARTKSDFLAVMSHELRTPLNGVLGVTSLLASTPLDAEQREYVDMVARSGQALLRLIDDILDFSKIEAGRVVLEQVTCDVGAIARDVVSMLGVQARAKGLDLHVDVAPGVPAPVESDPGRVRQVLFNLIGNAVKFTPTGSVHVGVSCGAIEGTRATLRVDVTDTGIGIPPETQQALFEKFTQADASTTRRFGGTGLGLAISKGLVESLGGAIGVSSAAGQGAHFWFTFPATVMAVPADVHPPMASSVTGGGEGEVARVLVAEDNLVNQRVTVRMLERLGFVADVAINGREAVSLVRTRRYAAILMDCHMPEMDGYQATRAILDALPAGQRPPIVAMTAAGPAHDRERCLAAGMDDYLAKPVRLALLAETLSRWGASCVVPGAAPTE